MTAVITLCGSTRFRDEYIQGLFGHSGDAEVWTEGTKELPGEMHLEIIGR